MKVIKILAILALAMFVVAEGSDMVRGYVDGYNEADEHAALKMQNPFSLSLEAESTLVPDTLKNLADGEMLPYVIHSAEVDGLQYPVWYRWGWSLACLFALLYIYGVYCVVRVILSVSRGEVFTRKNVRRMRIFAYALLATALVMELYQWMLYGHMASQVMLEGYRIASYTLKYPLFCYILLALFTEIFAVGVKLKEEQDLTI